MRKNIPLTLFLVFAGNCFFNLEAQSVIVKTEEGTGNSFLTNQVQNFTFTGINLFQKNIDGSIKTYRLSPITKIYFKSEATGIENYFLSNGNALSFYPNPVNDLLHFQNIPENNSMIAIFRVDGTLVIQTQISANNNFIDVSNLNNGIYLLKINNQVFKIVKL